MNPRFTLIYGLNDSRKAHAIARAVFLASLRKARGQR